MIQKTVEIAICGAGPAGQTLALLLIRRGVNPSDIILIDAKTEQEAQADKRTIALSYGSQQILQSASAWPVKATPIEQIHVSRKGCFGRTLITHTDHQVPALGYVAKYADILKPLAAALEKHLPDLSFLRPARVSTISQTDTHAEIQLADQRSIRAQIVVQAEGGLFSDQQAGARHHDYQQTALIAKVSTSNPMSARAYERFTDHGPLALLPDDHGYAMVWCVSPELAAQLMTLTDEQFLHRLQQAFGDRVGKFTHATARSAFVLGLNAETGAPDGRVIRIGNAAQTLHPVAGQGLNLGLRDAQQLAKLLSSANTPAALHDFYQARQADRNMTIQITDRMAQIFTTRTAGGMVTQSLLGAGLGLIDVCTPARQWLARQMMYGTR